MHPALLALDNSTIPTSWDVFLFNTKKCVFSIFIGLVSALLGIPVGIVLISQFPGDLSAQIPGAVVGIYGLVMLINAARRIQWLRSKARRRILVTDTEVISQWGDVVRVWPLAQIMTRSSAVRSQDAGRLVEIEIVNRQTQKRDFLTDNHWIGNSDLVKYAIDKRTGQVGGPLANPPAR